jgi:hypothetical protein
MAEAYCWRICTRSGRGDCGVVDRGRGARATMRERTACARPEIDYHTRDHDRGGPLAHSPESPRHQTTTAEPDPPGAAGRQPAGPSRHRRRRRRAPTLLHQPPSLAPPHAAYGAALSLASSSSSSASHASSPEDTRPQCCSAATHSESPGRHSRHSAGGCLRTRCSGGASIHTRRRCSASGSSASPGPAPRSKPAR